MAREDNTNSYKIILFLLLVSFVFSGNLAFGQTSISLSKTVYLDPKGFFKINPPQGWLIQEYTNDPRGKVNFNSSTAKPFAQIKIIGQRSRFKTLEEAREAERMGADRLSSRMRQRGIDLQVDLKVVNMLGTRLLRGELNYGGRLKQEVFWLLSNNNYFTIVYGAPPHLFDKYHSLAMDSIKTFKPISPAGTAKEVEQHTVASTKRKVRVYMHMGQKEAALEVINEGLAAYPRNQELIELKKQIKKQ